MRHKDWIFLIISGVLIIISGLLLLFNLKLFQLIELNFFKIIGLITIIVGIFLIIFNLRWKIYASPRSTLLLAAALVIFILSSAEFPVKVTGEIEFYALTRDRLTASVIDIKILTLTGNIYVSSSNDPSLVYNISFHKIRVPLLMEESKVIFKNKTSDNVLLIDAYSDMADVYVILGPNVTSIIDLSTNTGNVKLAVDGNVRVDTLRLKSSTGNIEAKLSGVRSLSSVGLSSSIGNVRFEAYLLDLLSDCAVDIRNDVGNVYIEIKVSRNVGCDFKGVTDLGAIKTFLQGFEEIGDLTSKYVHIRSENYEKSRYSITLTAETNIGNIYFYGRVLSS